MAETGQWGLPFDRKRRSGKSTLMKFIAKHQTTTALLRQWSDDKTLVVAGFYFWISDGMELHRSRVGLYKTILFKILSTFPKFIQEIFPRQWISLHHSRLLIEGSQYFSEEDIEKGFALLMESTHQKHKFCFLIDGLDECNGDWEDREKLAYGMYKD